MASRGVQVGARVCLATDSARPGVIESRIGSGSGGCWTVQFADKSRNIRVCDLEVLPSDDATFEPSQAPPNAKKRKKEKRASPVDRALKAATPPDAASSRKRRAEASNDAGAAAAAEASPDDEELGDGASGDELRVKRLQYIAPKVLESAPLFSSLDNANREIARLQALVDGALVETIDVDADGALESAAEAAAQRRGTTAAPASNLVALALLHASHETIVVAIKEERDTVTDERDKVTEDRDDQEDECKTAHNFIGRQKDVIGGLQDEIGGLWLEMDGLRREARRRDEAGARRVAELEAAIAELEAAAIEAPAPPTTRRARPK